MLQAKKKSATIYLYFLPYVCIIALFGDYILYKR